MQAQYNTGTGPGAVTAPGPSYFVVFPLDGKRYAVDMEHVELVVRAFAPAPLPRGPGTVCGLLNMHGRVIPLLNLRRIFGLPERELLSGDYFIITAGPAGARAITSDSIPDLAVCRAEQVATADEAVRGEYTERVIKTADGITLIFDPRRLPPAGSRADPGGAE